MLKVGEVCVNPTKSNNETEFTDLVEEIEGLTDSLNNTINVIKEKVANGTDKVSVALICTSIITSQFQ